MDSASVDIAILGGGPAGCATALRLRQHAPHLSVALVDAASDDRELIGETLPPPAQELLQGLRVWPEFLDQQHVQTFGTQSTWGGGDLGGDDFILTPFGRGWHLDRRKFDQMLLRTAEARGTTVFRECRFRHATPTTAGWDLELHSHESAHRLACSFVVDASGRRAIFATQNGARRIRDDSMVGVCCFFSCQADSLQDSRLVVEPVRDGWWYSTVLPRGRALAVFMTDSDIAKKLELLGGTGFHSALRKTVLTRRRFEPAEPEGPPSLVPAGSGCLSRVCGDKWVAVGDAAATLDPLSGQGILKATTNGIYAAYAIADKLAGDARGLDRYGRDGWRAYEQYLDLKDEYYDAERRWHTAKFWRRRQPRITLDPAAQVILPQHPVKPSFGLRRRVLSELSRTPQAAHEIVRRIKQRNPNGTSDRRVVLTLQRLIQSGHVRA